MDKKEEMSDETFIKIMLSLACFGGITTFVVIIWAIIKLVLHFTQ